MFEHGLYANRAALRFKQFKGPASIHFSKRYPCLPKTTTSNTSAAS
jgi:hypothetical protein